MEDCIFCKIAKKEIPAELIYEDEDVVAFPDLHPIKPIHLLVIPKKHYSEFIAVDNPALFSKINQVVQKLIRERGLQDKGYKITINGGGSQLVNHLHVHITGPMGNAAPMN